LTLGNTTRLQSNPQAHSYAESASGHARINEWVAICSLLVVEEWLGADHKRACL
jgi:hypothetical protein